MTKNFNDQIRQEASLTLYTSLDLTAGQAILATRGQGLGLVTLGVSTWLFLIALLHWLYFDFLSYRRTRLFSPAS